MLTFSEKEQSDIEAANRRYSLLKEETSNMAAYAAVLLLRQGLEDLLHLMTGKWSESYLERIKSWVCFMEGVLKASDPEKIKVHEDYIRNLANSAQRIVDSCISKNSISFNRRIKLLGIGTEIRDLTELVQFVTANDLGNEPKEMGLLLLSSSSNLCAENTIVGLDTDLLRIKEQLIGLPLKLNAVSIVGMGGIGKTFLARTVYDDPYMVHHFYIRVWVTVSKDHQVRDILLHILCCISTITDEVHQWSDACLSEKLYRLLKGKRYLIVMDDIWNAQTWNDVRRSFPDDKNGSRIIFTSRNTDVAPHANINSSLHQLSLLSMDASFKLLTLKVFGQEHFPPELERIGKQILDKCQGLPLAIVVAAGFLSKIKRTPYCWENVEKELSSHMIRQSEQCSDILALSYNYLPHHLKLCFLYMGAFKHNLEISVSKLIRLWIAEGFACETSHKTPEEVAEKYLEDLIKRSLIVPTKRRSDGRVKTCGLHDLLKDLIIRKAQEVGFLQVIESSSNVFREMGSKCRVSFYSDVFGIVSEERQNYSTISRKHGKFPTRSILCFGRFDVNRPLPEDSVFSFTNFKLLRVLDISFHPFNHFPEEILQLKFVRYLALASFNYIPSSVATLRLLQTLIRYSHEEDLVLPTSIWHLKQLRHLYFKKSSHFPVPTNLTHSPKRPQPTLSSSMEEYLCLRNLQTLSNISLTSCTRLVFIGTPNLKKLGVRETKDECKNDEEMLVHLSNIKVLLKLETLKCFFIKPRPLPQYDSFPPNLKKLTLRGCHQPWKEMTVLAALPNLEVLKLKYYAFEGPEWEMTEGFCRLKFLMIDGSDLMEWEASSSHFPNLQSLVLRFCNLLREIPDGIGEINTLELIDLCECSDSAYNSAKQIQLDQQDLGNDGLTVRIRQHYNCE